MKLDKESSPLLQKRNILIAYAVLIIVVVGTVIVVSSTRIFETSRTGEIPQLVWLLIALILLFSVILVLSKTLKVLSEIEQTNIKLEKIAELLDRSNKSLEKITQSLQPNQAPDVTASSSQEQQAPKAVVGEIAHASTGDAADDQEIVRVTAEVEKLFQEYRWAEASKQIEDLIAAYPDSQQAHSMRRKLADKKQARKKILLAAWDAAVHRGATDRSLEILKELDPYLLPNEDLTLQEAAQDVYKNKLHNLGVRFSLAVSGGHWKKAFEVGREITDQFPNSRMAEEIRGKIDVLRQKAEGRPG